MACVIKHVAHPYASAVLMARKDHAHITGQNLVERPWWYEDLETKYLYHDLYGCIGWPSEVSDKDLGLPGYAAIVAVLREDDSLYPYNPMDAEFLVLDEAESMDVPTLLKACIALRNRYGFGIQPDLLTIWYGDQERFLQNVALFNERLEPGKELLITPPNDFFTPKVFDVYVRSLRSVLMEGHERLYFGKTDILKNRILEFRRDDPAILATGGLIHSMLARTMWMDETRESTIFNVEDVA